MNYTSVDMVEPNIMLSQSGTKPPSISEHVHIASIAHGRRARMRVRLNKNLLSIINKLRVKKPTKQCMLTAEIAIAWISVGLPMHVC